MEPHGADITAMNVRELDQVWEWRPAEAEAAESVASPVPPSRFQATPIMVGDTLYLSTPLNQTVALDAETGRHLGAASRLVGFAPRGAGSRSRNARTPS